MTNTGERKTAAKFDRPTGRTMRKSVLGRLVIPAAALAVLFFGWAISVKSSNASPLQSTAPTDSGAANQGAQSNLESSREASAEERSSKSNAVQDSQTQSSESSGANPLLEGLDFSQEAGESIGSGDGRKSKGVPSTGSQDDAPPLLAAYFAMQTAADLLERGSLDQPTQDAQQQAIDLLEEIIQMAEADQASGAEQSQSASSSSSTAESSGTNAEPAGAQEEDASASGEPGQQRGSDGDDTMSGAADGTQAPGTPTGVASAVPMPLDANGEAVWGHLPVQARGLLRADLPTEFLPDYAEQISAYFRKLAELPADE